MVICLLEKKQTHIRVTKSTTQDLLDRMSKLYGLPTTCKGVVYTVYVYLFQEVLHVMVFMQSTCKLTINCTIVLHTRVQCLILHYTLFTLLLFCKQLHVNDI